RFIESPDRSNHLFLRNSGRKTVTHFSGNCSSSSLRGGLCKRAPQALAEDGAERLGFGLSGALRPDGSGTRKQGGHLLGRQSDRRRSLNLIGLAEKPIDHHEIALVV
ncbi:hypothetical protein EN857_33920, partial [Mesorhizobium sp. M4B.F.Ca.ET.214.01.1.1]